ncbi:MAG TPA: S-methyl-5'-thioadenosine phosphorylase [Polyangia bacterium]|jgi:5'-methylthioadenosine phosphorylase
MVQPRAIGVIGGSGLYEMEGLTSIERVRLDTPFGAPSDEYVVGSLGDVKMVFLPRHGRGHRIPPHQINFRANIHGMKQLGVEWIISVSAVGSMREDIRPGDIVVVDQFFDRTRMRVSSFFEDGCAGHVQFADPVCNVVAAELYAAAQRVGARVHQGGTYICMEGPQFSTRAESRIYRQWGVDVIGMTNVPEAKLAREAEICYATIALATDYDCWHETEDDVSIEAVLEIIRNNVAMAKSIIREAAGRIPRERTCACASAAKWALISDGVTLAPEVRARLALILGKYLPKEA